MFTKKVKPVPTGPRMEDVAMFSNVDQSDEWKDNIRIQAQTAYDTSFDNLPEGYKLIHIVSTNLFDFRAEARKNGVTMGEYFDEVIGAEIDQFEPKECFPIKMTTEYRLPLNQTILLISEGVWLKLLKRATALGLGRNSLLIYFFSERYKEN